MWRKKCFLTSWLHTQNSRFGVFCEFCFHSFFFFEGGVQLLYSTSFEALCSALSERLFVYWMVLSPMHGRERLPWFQQSGSDFRGNF